MAAAKEMTIDGASSRPARRHASSESELRFNSFYSKNVIRTNKQLDVNLNATYFSQISTRNSMNYLYLNCIRDSHAKIDMFTHFDLCESV